MNLLVSATIACLEEQKSGYFLFVLVLSVVMTFMTQFSDVVPCALFAFFKAGKLIFQEN